MLYRHRTPEPLPVRSPVQIVALAMIILASFLPYAAHLDRLDRLTKTETNQLGSN